MSSYKELPKKPTDPTLKQMILALTWTHDQILQNPDKIRSFFYNTCNKMPQARVDDFYNDNDGLIDYENSQADAIMSTLTDKYTKPIWFYSTNKLGSTGPGCCTKEENLYTRYELDRENQKINMVSFYVTINICSDYGGGTHYKLPKPCTITDLTFKDFLIQNPKCIEDFDLETDLELLLKEIGETYP